MIDNFLFFKIIKILNLSKIIYDKTKLKYNRNLCFLFREKKYLRPDTECMEAPLMAGTQRGRN